METIFKIFVGILILPGIVFIRLMWIIKTPIPKGRRIYEDLDKIRILDDKGKKEAVSIAHKSSMVSIVTSGCSSFAATFGVACYSQVDMIGSICTLLSRGALISMVVVIFILPAMLLVFDKVIIKTTMGFRKKKQQSQLNLKEA